MMKIVSNPSREEWRRICARPAIDAESIEVEVRTIMERVRREGDEALIDLTARFDGARLAGLAVSRSEIDAANGMIDGDLRQAIERAARAIETFHAAQRENPVRVETATGVICWRRSIPIERVGLYVPGGTAPLFSTLLMLGIPARLAGCDRIVVTTPPRADGSVAPAILYTARLLGIDEIYKVGGAQAVGALAYGTGTVPAVDKVFGPGNPYVTIAKLIAQSQGIAIDLPAGPSEVLVIADETANPRFVAADLLSQAEHGRDSQVLLVTSSASIAERVAGEIERQLVDLPRRDVAAASLAGSVAVVVGDLEEAIELSNLYAPEHLILAVDDPERLADRVVNAGSVFLGHYAPESLGDYASGTNHTLPTNGCARSYGGVSLDSFVRKVTFQQISPEGLRAIGPSVIRMAEAESLRGHATAVEVRLRELAGREERTGEIAEVRDV